MGGIHLWEEALDFVTINRGYHGSRVVGGKMVSLKI